MKLFLKTFCLALLLVLSGGVGAESPVLILVTVDGKYSCSTSNQNSAACSVQIDDLMKVIQEIRKTEKTRTIKVEFGPGVFRLSNPIVLTGRDASNIEFVGSAEGTSEIVGSAPVNNFRKYSKEVDETLGEKADVEHVYVADLSADIKEPLTFAESGFGHRPVRVPMMLVAASDLMILAREPDEGFVPIISITPGENGQLIKLSLDMPPENRLRKNVFISGYFSSDWAFERRFVGSAAGALTKFDYPSNGVVKIGQRVYLENSLYFLNNKSEFFFSNDTRKLYFFPRNEQDLKTAEIVKTEAVLKLTSAHDVAIRNITIKNFLGTAVTFLGVRNIVVDDIRLTNIGNRGLFVSGRNVLINKIISKNTGDGGVYVYGGDKKTLQSGQIKIENSLFENYAWNSRSYRPAVFLGGVGNSLKNSVINNGPHAAIIFDGNNFSIRDNVIFKTNLETSDSGAIYAGRSWSSRGTIIVHNYIHDIGRRDDVKANMGIYLDDQIGGVDIRNNFFERVNQAVFVGGGSQVNITNNTFYECNPAVYVDARGTTWQKGWASDGKGPLLGSLSLVSWNDNDVFQNKYPLLKEIVQRNPGKPMLNVINANLFVKSQPFVFVDHADKYVSSGTNWNEDDIKIKVIDFDENTRNNLKPPIIVADPRDLDGKDFAPY